jgi:hypothetical protein
MVKWVWDTPHASQPIRSTTKGLKNAKKISSVVALVVVLHTTFVRLSAALRSRVFVRVCFAPTLSFPSLLSCLNLYVQFPGFWIVDCILVTSAERIGWSFSELFTVLIFKIAFSFCFVFFSFFFRCSLFNSLPCGVHTFLYRTC